MTEGTPSAGKAANAGWHGSSEVMLDDDAIVALSKAWLEEAVIGLNLCPFANAVHRRGQITWKLSHARTPAALLEALGQALQSLLDTPAETTDTCLLIHPWVLHDFLDFNDFLSVADELLEDNGLIGVVQIASFHPDYRFGGVDADDITNHTNRSPFPMLHLLREDSLDKAIAAMPDSDQIVERNLESLRKLGPEGWQQLQQRIRTKAGR
ncbi:MAG: hypothetical protein RL404_732 [Pseudomonadota bacterium]|jgi:hypothetical protein